MSFSQRTSAANRIDTLFGVCICRVKRREAASHERLASRQLKWREPTNDYSTVQYHPSPPLANQQ